jgi:hypothetical protein
MNRERVQKIARRALAIALLAGLLASIFPSETLATAPMCTLACCAGRAPHAAGSCMDGSCQAALRKRSTHSHGARPPVREQFCGFSSLTRRHVSLRGANLMPAGQSQTKSHHSQLASFAINKPCRPDCGGCASGFASLNRNHAAAARGDRQRATSHHQSANSYILPLRTLTGARRRSAPRGPPVSFS